MNLSKIKRAFSLMGIIIYISLICSCGMADDVMEKAYELESNEKNEASESSNESSKSSSKSQNTDPVRKETPVPEKPDFSGAYKAYLDILNEDKWLIDEYYWQNDDWYANKTKGVFIANIYGDEIPELAYVKTKKEKDGIVMYATFNVYTFDSGKAELIYSDILDGLAAGSWNYAFFKVKGSDDLYIYEYHGDAYFNEDYYVLRVGQDSKGHLEMICGYKEYYNSYDGDPVYYSSNENDTIEKQDYEALTSKINNDAEKLYMIDEHCLNYGKFSAGKTMENTAMTAFEAMTFLKTELGEDVGVLVPEKEWKAAYKKAMFDDRNIDVKEYDGYLHTEYGYGFHVVDLDNNGIPEIILESEDYGFMYEGFYYNKETGKAESMQIYYGMSFLPGTGMIHSFGGRSGYYNEKICKVTDGGFELMYEFDLYLPVYGEDRPDNTYSVNGRSCTKEEYDKIVKENYPRDNVAYFERYGVTYNYSHLLSYLES